jgi:hypothetical protein
MCVNFVLNAISTVLKINFGVIHKNALNANGHKVEVFIQLLGVVVFQWKDDNGGNGGKGSNYFQFFILKSFGVQTQ